MNQEEKKLILNKAQKWFRQTSKKHIVNTKKLTKASSFDINPFLAVYLANFLSGNSKPESIAKALVYPRALGTSITTSFGTNIQKFTNANRIIIVACGTSWQAGLVAEYIFEDWARVPVEVEYASEFRYRNPVITENDVVIAISQSGETADTLSTNQFTVY